jgi:hypothetical protein
MDRYCIHKQFNRTTGAIDRKYAWDALIYDLKRDGTLKKILDYILEKEKA